MNKTWLCLVGLILVSSYFQIAVTGSDSSSYDPMADVNRDKTIDVHDLSRLGRAYGSTQTIPTQPGKTTIYVYQLETDPPQIENARVAVFNASNPYPYTLKVVQVSYTDSSGIASFSLNPDTDYTAIVWSETTYNYADFTTNEVGEASVSLHIGFPRLPPNWVVITVRNLTSGELYEDWVDMILLRLLYVESTGDWEAWESYLIPATLGIGICAYDWGIIASNHWVAMAYSHSYGELLAEAGYTADENGNANVVIYV